MNENQAMITLESLLGEKNHYDFLSSIQHRVFYKCQLQDGLSKILTIYDLEEIINTRRLSFPRCRLVRSGRPITPSEYNEHHHYALGEAIKKLHPERVMQELVKGATLVLDFAEDLSLNIQNIVEAISTEFQEKTGATVFYSVGNDKGFTTHWDNSDTLIFQLSGRKKWLLYTPNLPFPVADNSITMETPQGDPAETFILDENEFLYLPRGYWHAPEPCGSHSLHISFAFRRRNGIDFIKSLLPLFSKHLPFREDINKYASLEEKNHYIDKLKLSLENILTIENLNNFVDAACKRKFVSQKIVLDRLRQKD